MSKRGTYQWYELLTTDVEGARAFYSKVVGWTSEVYNPGPPPYLMWKMGEAGIGGLMDLPEQARAMGAPSHWLAYVECDDVDATAAKAAELGGKVFMPPTTYPAIGRWAILGDPQGGVFAAFKGANADAMLPYNGLGSFCWHELVAPDPEAAFGFYAARFGWVKHEAMDMGEMGTYQLFGLEGSKDSLGGMMRTPPDMPVAAWTFYAVVDDITRATADIKAAGGTVMVDSMQVPGGSWITMCMDPQGAAFAVLSQTKSG